MFVYVILSALLVAVQSRAVRLGEAGLFRGHYEPCQQAAQLQHTLGPQSLNERGGDSGFITQGFGDERDSVTDKQSGAPSNLLTRPRLPSGAALLGNQPSNLRAGRPARLLACILLQDTALSSSLPARPPPCR